MRTLINIKVEDEVKRQAKLLASDLGLSLSAIVNAFLKQFIRNKEIRFSSMPRMTHELEYYLKDIELDIKNKKNLSNALKGSDEVNTYLDSSL